ncbi:hypothetical protein PFICI_08490 [Pestalotiopsis fici W106-1]|uniref:Unsaturated glucuronyl hydrolase n=1 Tax=Pestalotiopsis fici (strain W106-1 / CGMCC3.15140) TaxID=1229662 RepID=W3X704_PESFW|nr:uncharacterized protein PFICI_08490 [Pestalotiopsis fici W106-1]ETS80961.1 hypothetical protein PFICI_08490 [Pestalotiopsis fici W106-1]
MEYPEPGLSPKPLSASDMNSVSTSPLLEAEPASSDTSVQSEPLLCNTKVPSSILPVDHNIGELYDQNILAKLLRTARQAESHLPNKYPEVVPQNGPDMGRYQFREAEFWTCGFFPGSLYSMLERAIKYPQMLGLNDKGPSSGSPRVKHVREQLLRLCKTWAEPLHSMANRTDTHDIGFIIMPALRLDWELLGDSRSLDSIIRAARSLATRFVAPAKAIRSWDLIRKKDVEITSMEDNLILIIDSMCNLDLLYYAAAHSEPDRGLSEIATQHANTILRTHLRPEKAESVGDDVYQGQWYSTFHVANLDPASGSIKQRMTAQGFADDSTWARGQAWAILGYAQTYMWTKDEKFLDASCGCTEYFVHRLENSDPCVEIPNHGAPGITKGRYTPLWDFDAPIDDATNQMNPLRDSSAGAIAANGMLIAAQALAALGRDMLAGRFRALAMNIICDLLEFALAPERAMLVCSLAGHVQIQNVEPGVFFEGILKYGTANNNANARKRYANHTLVYGDYYLVEFGNNLLRAGLI